MDLAVAFKEHQQWRHDSRRQNDRAVLNGQDLTGNDYWLSNRNWACAGFKTANLAGVIASGSDFSYCSFAVADLSKADFRGSCLYDADLTRANLTGTDFRGASLVGARLSGARVVGADFRGADLNGTLLGSLDLRDAIMDDCYDSIPFMLHEVRDVVLANTSRLNMRVWHSDDNWILPGRAAELHECGTNHCLAGWAHYLAARKNPALASDKINTYLVGLRALGPDAAELFSADEDEVISWLKGVPCTTNCD